MTVLKYGDSDPSIVFQCGFRSVSDVTDLGCYIAGTEGVDYEIDADYGFLPGIVGGQGYARMSAAIDAEDATALENEGQFTAYISRSAFASYDDTPSLPTGAMGLLTTRAKYIYGTRVSGVTGSRAYVQTGADWITVQADNTDTLAANLFVSACGKEQYALFCSWWSATECGIIIDGSEIMRRARAGAGQPGGWGDIFNIGTRGNASDGLGREGDCRLRDVVLATSAPTLPAGPTIGFFGDIAADRAGFANDAGSLDTTTGNLLRAEFWKNQNQLWPSLAYDGNVSYSICDTASNNLNTVFPAFNATAPQIAIIMAGITDAVFVSDAEVSNATTGVYARIDGWLTTLLANGTTTRVVVVGPGSVKNRTAYDTVDINNRRDSVNSEIVRACDNHSGATFVDAYTLLGGDDLRNPNYIGGLIGRGNHGGAATANGNLNLSGPGNVALNKHLYAATQDEFTVSNLLRVPVVPGEDYPVVELTNPQNTPEPDGATLTIESNSDLGTLYSYSKTTPFTGTDEENAAEIMANGVGQVPVVGTNTRVVTGQDGMTQHYAGWVQDSEASLYGDDQVMVFSMGAGETLTIPGGAGTYLFDIDWGDGTGETGLTTEGAGPHTYTDAIEAVVRVSGAFPHVYFNNGGDIGKLIRILNWGDTSWSAANAAFYGATNLVEASSGVSNTSSVTNMRDMMRDWWSVASPPDIGSWDTSSVTETRSMMRDWRSMTSPPDFSSWDTSSFSNMAYMMYSWSSMTSPPDFSSWDTSSANNMASMMRDWSSMTSPPDLSSWDTSSVTSVAFMMSNWSSMGAIDITIDTWDVGVVIDFTGILSGSQLTTACYDRTLASWGNQTLAAGASGQTIHFGTSQYTDAASHALLLAQVTNIIDGGLAP